MIKLTYKPVHALRLSLGLIIRAFNNRKIIATKDRTKQVQKPLPQAINYFFDVWVVNP